MSDKPQEGVIEKGFTDAIYGRSKGGKTFSGWDCESLPYIVELDNYGRSRHLGEPNVKGEFLWDWVMRIDANGYLEMPGGRTASTSDLRWHYANNPSDLVPTGRGDEAAIRAVWELDLANRKK